MSGNENILNAECIRAGPVPFDYQPQGIVQVTVTSEKAGFIMMGFSGAYDLLERINAQIHRFADMRLTPVEINKSPCSLVTALTWPSGISYTDGCGSKLFIIPNVIMSKYDLSFSRSGAFTKSYEEQRLGVKLFKRS